MKLFIHENPSENIICEMVAILSRGRWVKITIGDGKLGKGNPHIDKAIILNQMPQSRERGGRNGWGTVWCLIMLGFHWNIYLHWNTYYSDIIMSAMASQITSVSIVYSTVCSGAYQRKHESSASLAFVRGIHWWLVNSPHKGPVTRKMFPFDDVIMTHEIPPVLVT